MIMHKEIREHKSILFSIIFNDRENLLSLYNALSGRNLKDPDELYINTLDNITWLGMKNDLSFLISFIEMYSLEHQSTLSPNFPVRFLISDGRLYEEFIKNTEYYVYGKKEIPLPAVKHIVLYNGIDADFGDKMEMKLSSAFQRASDLELKVTVYNINYEKNQELMKACRPLKEYAWLIREIRKRVPLTRGAVITAVRSMPEGYVIKKRIMENYEEVIDMLFTIEDDIIQLRKMEQNYKNDLEAAIAKASAEARVKAKAEGKAEEREKGICIMYAEIYDLTGEHETALKRTMKRYPDYSEEEIRKILKQNAD